MKPKTLLIVTTLTLVLGAFIIFVERDLPSTDKRRQLDKKVLGLDAEDVTSLQLRWGDQEVRFEKEPARDDQEARDGSGATWRLASPYQGRADSVAVSGLLSRLLSLEKKRTLEDFDAAELGLISPRAVAVLATTRGEYVLKLGSELALSSSVVVQGDDAGVAFQVENAADLIGELTQEPGEWRDKKLFLADRGDIDRVALVDGGRRIELARRGAAEVFWLESPEVDRVESEAISGLLTTLTGLRAETFVDQPPENDPELSDQRIEVQIKGEPQLWTLELGSVVDTEASGEAPLLIDETSLRYARAGEQWVQLDASRLEQPLANTAGEWRSKAWSAIQVFKIDYAGFEIGEEAFAISRTGGDWQRDSVKVAYDVASDALYPLGESRALRLLDRQAAIAEGHSFTTPRLRVALTASDGVEESLALFPAVGDVAAATVGGREVILLLDAVEADKLIASVVALRDAEALPEAQATPAAATH